VGCDVFVGANRVLRLEDDVSSVIDEQRSEGMVAVVTCLPSELDRAPQVLP
jgi:hypothetical protein